jgi:hypothetical protein
LDQCMRHEHHKVSAVYPSSNTLWPMTHRPNSCSRIPLNNGPFLKQLAQAIFSTGSTPSRASIHRCSALRFSTASVGVACATGNHLVGGQSGAQNMARRGGAVDARQDMRPPRRPRRLPGARATGTPARSRSP